LICYENWTFWDKCQRNSQDNVKYVDKKLILKLKVKPKCVHTIL